MSELMFLACAECDGTACDVCHQETQEGRNEVLGELHEEFSKEETSEK
jgi:hypothetical protein